MDPITHSLIGVTIAEAGGAPRYLGRPTAWAVALTAANLPDIDALLLPFLGLHGYVVGTETVTHSVWAMAVLPLVVGGLATLVMKRRQRRAGTEPPPQLFRRAAWLALAAGLSHLLLDVLSTAGVRVLTPLDMVRTEGGWLYWFDPFLWGLVLLAWWLPPLRRRPSRRRARIVLSACAVYLAACGAVHGWALSQARDLAERKGIAVEQVSAWPTILPTVRSAVVIDDQERAHGVAIALLSSAEGFAWSRPTNRHDRIVERVLATPIGRTFERWAAVPLARVGHAVEDQSRSIVELIDLRYEVPGLGGGSFRLVMDVERRPGVPADQLYGVVSAEWRWPFAAADLVGLDVPSLPALPPDPH